MQLLSNDLTLARNKNPLAGYIVIELCFVKNNKRVLYDVDLDLTCIVYTNDADLAKCERGFDYISVRIMLTSALEQLQLFAYTKEFVGQPRYGIRAKGVQSIAKSIIIQHTYL